MPCRKEKQHIKFGLFEVIGAIVIVLVVILLAASYESGYTATVTSDKLVYKQLWGSWTYPIAITGLDGTYYMEASRPFVKGQVVKIKAARWNIKQHLVHAPGC